MQYYSGGAASKKNDEIIGANSATREFEIGCDEAGRNNGSTEWPLKANLLIVAVVTVVVVVTLLSASHVDHRSTRLHADAVSSKKVELPVAVTSDVRWGKNTQNGGFAGMFKFAVAIKGSDGGKSKCTGSLVARNKVLTAGHCCLFEGDVVVAGTHNVKFGSPGYQSLKIKKTAVPDEFEPHGLYTMRRGEFSENTFIYDICVITLDGDFDVQRGQIIAPYYGGPPRMQEPVKFAGWGYYNDLKQIPYDMRWGPGKVADCTHIRPREIPRRGEVICVLGDKVDSYDYGASPCKGDSGGPLVNAFEDRLYGVLVDGLGRLDDSVPGRTGCFGGGAWWTSVYAYRDWIRDQMQDAHLCGLSLETESDDWTGSMPVSAEDDSDCPFSWKLISPSSSEAIHFAQCGMERLPKAQHVTYKFGRVFVAARQTVGTTVNMRISAIIFQQKIVFPEPGKVVPVSVLMEVTEMKPHCGLKKLIGMYDGLPLNETSLANVGSHHHDDHFHVADPSGWREVPSLHHTFSEAQSAGKFAAKKMSMCAFEAVSHPQYQVMSNGFRFYMTVMVKNSSTGKTVLCTAEVHATVHEHYHLVKGHCSAGQGC